MDLAERNAALGAARRLFGGGLLYVRVIDLAEILTASRSPPLGREGGGKGDEALHVLGHGGSKP